MYSLVEKECPVKRVALDGLESSVADDAADFLFGGAGVRTEDGADVVAAEAKAHLQDFKALLVPVGLHVRDVVEEHAADGESPEVLDGGRVVEVAARGCMGGDEGERLEAAGFLLKRVDGLEKGDEVGAGRAGTEDERDGGRDAGEVGGAVGVEPGRQGEGVAGGAGDAIQAGGLEAGEEVRER